VERGVTSQPGLWSAERHMAVGEGKLLVMSHKRATLCSLTAENQLGIFTLLQLIQGSMFHWCKSPAEVLPCVDTK